jgi:hypothetical protein
MGAVACLVLGVSAQAHHGVAVYDASKTITLMGTVAEFHFANPHTIIYFEVKDPNGSMEQWQGELTSPNLLERYGWNSHSLKMGDRITVLCHPARTGAKSAWVTKIVLPSGQELDADMQ